jgi:hypothetical protein
MGPVPGSVDESGKFTFEQLPPGAYELSSEATDFRLNERFGGYLKIVVDQDLDLHLELSRQPEFDIQFEEQHGKTIDPKQVTVWTRRKTLAGEGAPRRIRPQLDQLPPGNWELSVTPPAGMYVASIRAPNLGDYSSFSAAGGWKEFFLSAGRPLLIKVILSSTAAALIGKVTGSGEAAAGAPVFLEPLDIESGVGLIGMRTARTDLQGRYRFPGLPPGRYLALSSFDLDPPSHQEMETHATVVSLKDASEADQNLELFTAQ